MRLLLIENNIAVNVIESDSAPADGRLWVDITNIPNVGIGYTYNGTAFLAPIVQATDKKITRLAFLNRFTDAEAIAIDLASIGATTQAAAIRRYQSKVDAAKYIDLDRADTRAGVLALETLGLIASGRGLQILDNPIQESEKP